MLSFDDFKNHKEKIAVVGLGYVGMPLLFHLSKQFNTIGFDINEKRVSELNKGIDITGELNGQLNKDCGITFTSSPSDLSNAKVIIIAVPTPVDEHKLPDLSPLKEATKLVGKNLSKGSIVVYESTVYPGTTEEICAPILESFSNLKYNKEFFVGYSPERINPGDKVHTVDKITKIVSAGNRDALELLSGIYGSITQGGIFKAVSIKTAEAAKVIENTQRDLNIALMNELSIIFNIMKIDTKSVIEAASTKWNFLHFEPGLVGGHCIGVDPYYLTYKAEELGYNPQVILAGRRINDSMGKYIAEQAVKKMIACGKTILNANALVLGITFKENIKDIRNSKVVDIIKEMKDFGVNIDVYDPYADSSDVENTYNIKLADKNSIKQKYDCIILSVKHNKFMDNKEWILNLLDENGVLIDIKAAFKNSDVGENLNYWRL